MLATVNVDLLRSEKGRNNYFKHVVSSKELQKPPRNSGELVEWMRNGNLHEFKCRAGDWKSAKMIYGDVASTKGLSYRARLGRLGIYSLECRRLRGDLMDVHNSRVAKIGCIQSLFPPGWKKSRTRGPRFKAKGKYLIGNWGATFSQRMERVSRGSSWCNNGEIICEDQVQLCWEYNAGCRSELQWRCREASGRCEWQGHGR